MIPCTTVKAVLRGSGACWPRRGWPPPSVWGTSWSPGLRHRRVGRPPLAATVLDLVAVLAAGVLDATVDPSLDRVLRDRPDDVALAHDGRGCRTRGSGRRPELHVPSVAR
jgi:hypothetical protein